MIDRVISGQNSLAGGVPALNGGGFQKKKCGGFQTRTNGGIHANTQIFTAAVIFRCFISQASL
jgi:hypothetical protein